jgi:hypothetical protein
VFFIKKLPARPARLGFSVAGLLPCLNKASYLLPVYFLDIFNKAQMEPANKTESFKKGFYSAFLKKPGVLVIPSFVIGISFLMVAFIKDVSIRDSVLKIYIETSPNPLIAIVGVLYTLVGISMGLFKYIENTDEGLARRFIQAAEENNLSIQQRMKDLLEQKEGSIADSLKVEPNEINDSATKTDSPKIIPESIPVDFNKFISEKVNEFYNKDFSKLIKKYNNLKQIDFFIKELQAGVNKQIDRLSRSGTINLIIGLLTTLVAIALLTNIVLNAGINHFDNTKDFLIYSIPRVSLALFIEIFSFFFLRLYKANLEDVKYFHNERTNIDTSIIALKLALSLNDKKTAIHVVKSLLKVERNFVLKKGESTIGLRKAALDDAREIDVLSKLSDVISKIRK